MNNYLLRRYTNIGGNSNNVEGIVNYISSRIEGKKPNEILSYPGETEAIYMLAQKMDEKSIIKSAWDSNEKEFKQNYIEAMGKDIPEGEKSYNDFQIIMRRLNRSDVDDDFGKSKKNNKKYLEELKQVFDGKKKENEVMKRKLEKLPQREFKFPSVPDKKNELSISQRISKFFEKHELLMKLPIVKKFVTKNLNALPPAENQKETKTPSTISQREAFMNEITCNGELRKLKPLQTQSKGNQNKEKDNRQIDDENER